MKANFTVFLTLILSVFSVSAIAQEKDFFQNKYLIVLDMQEDYIYGKIPDSAAYELIANINSIIDKVDTNKIVYVKTEMLVASLSFKGISVDTIANLEFCKNLQIANNNIFVKTDGNAFSNNDLATFFNAKNAEDIIVVGLLAEQCVSRTTNGGLELGYHMFLIPNAILGKKEKTKSKAIKKLIDNGASVML